MPSEADWQHQEAGKIIKKSLNLRDDIAVKDRMRILRGMEVEKKNNTHGNCTGIVQV